METNHSWLQNTEIVPESEAIVNPILPGATGREEQSSGIGGDRLELSLLPPVVAQPVTPDLLFDDPIQEAIAPNLSPPEPLEPPSPARADPLVGVRANQEATARDTGNGLLAEYFHNSDLTNPALTRIDRTVDFTWNKESPDPSMAKETFSARWTGFVQPEFTETYSFITQSDDGVRLWVNGELLIDKWKNQRVTEHSGAIDLEGGQLYEITLEYYENQGNAVSKLLWSSPSQSQEIIPTSRLYPADIILSNEPAPNPLTLQFFTDGFYNPGENVRFRGKVAGNSDVVVDFSLQKDDGEWIDIEDATVLELDSDDPGYAFFSYQLSGLEPGRYQLRALAIDQNGNVGETVIQSFQVLDLPPGQELPPTVKRAIAYNSNLDNYSPSELAATQEWTVNITGDRTSEALAASIGAENLGPTGPVANSYIWRFPPEMDPWEVASQLDALQGVQFAYPQVQIEVRSLFVPNDRFFDRQWHLSKNGEGAEVDINVIPAWDLATGEGVAIGIVDDGVQYIHPDLNDNFLGELSIDLNDADQNPDPIYTITMDGGLSAPQPIIDDGYDWTDFPVFIEQKGLVSEATVTFDFAHPFPDELDFYLVSARGTEWELKDIDGSGSYSIDTNIFNGEDVTGQWTLVLEDTDIGNQGFLNSWSLGLTVAGAHGTAVAGVAVASGNNSLGVSGVAPDANWAALRLTADAVSDGQIAEALYADDRNQAIQIYNNSWKPPVVWTGVNSLAALHRGVTNGRGGLGNIYLFGAGNDWFESQDYRENLNYNALASSRYTIAVGAIDHTGKKAWYSQEGASLLISAPSGGSRDDSLGITTTDLIGPDGRNADGTGEYGPNLDNNDYTNDFDGTSAATPVVSGVIALMLEANPNLSWRDVQHILIQTANRDQINDRDAGWSGKSADEIQHSYKYGFGVVDAAAAVNAAVDWTSVAPETLISSETITVGKKIRDNNPFGLRRGADITDDITVESVEVVLDISHEFRGDLEIELISPSGEKSLLANSLYDEGDDYNNWVFTSLRHWGESSKGEWQLVVRDKFPGNRGTLNSWQLNLYGTPTATVSIEATDPIASEDGDRGEFTITRTGDLDDSLIVTYSVAGTATASIDYEALTGTVEIPAGQTSAQVAIIPQEDDTVEVDETLFVVIDADDSYAIGPNDQATVTITDNDVANSPPTLTLIDTLTGATEEKSFTISYSDLFEKSNADDAEGDPISFEISTIASGILMKDDIAVEPGVTISSGETVVWTPNTFGDEVAAFTVLAFDGTDYSLEPVQVLVSVAAEPIVSINATDANASEDGDTAELTITRTGDTTESLEISFSIAGDAEADTDYSAIDNIIIPTGLSAVKVIIDPFDDEEIEADETATVNLETGTGYKLGGDRSASVIIADNDSTAIDLESQIFFSADGLSFVAGDSFKVGFVAINNGPEAAGSFNVAFYLSSDDTITSDDRLLGNYEISGLGGYRNTGRLLANLTLPDTGDAFWNGDGDYTLGMRVDSDNVISESDEDNNANTGAFKDKVAIEIANTQLNQPPVATDDATTITQGSTAIVAVLTNDSDPDDDPLTITGVSNAASGDVSISDNNVVYTPNVGFAGEDSLTYTVSDGQGGTDTATVSVTVEPPPSARVTVTVNQVKAIDDMEQGLLGGSGEAEFFTKLTINGQTWESPFKSNQNHIVPNWQFSQEVTDFTVPITINMHEHDGGLFGGTNDVDINPDGGVKRLNLLYDLQTGQISGDASGKRGEQIYVRGEGDSLRAEIWFTIDSTFSEDSIPTNHWKAAFINRTNSNVDDRALYNFSNPEAVLDLGAASGDGKIRLYQNWNASPASGVQSDYFAMQAWTRTNFEADKLYKITTQSDDGTWYRLQNVNTGAWTGNSVVEADDGADWRDRATWNPPKTIMFKVPETGEYDFYAEFYDRAGEAVVDFSVEEVEFFSESVNQSVQWQAEFFWWDRQEGNQPPTNIFAAGGDRNNAIAVVNLGNNTRDDGNKGLSFNWADGLPNNDARLPNENFAILATTETYFEAGRKYKARVRGDDGFQLLAQNQDSKELVYITPENNWAQSYGDHQEIEFTVPSDGNYDVQVQFYEERGDANFDLSWEPVNFTGRTIATTNTNVRSGPSRDFDIVGKLRNGTPVTFDKWTEGEFISYPSLGTASSLWYRIAGTDNWISAAIIDGSP